MHGANNPTKRLNLNSNKLANVRRDIVNGERLTKVEVQAIQLKVKQRDGNTTSCEGDANVTPEEQHANKNQENDKQNSNCVCSTVARSRSFWN